MRGDNWDVWVYDLERGVSTRFTFDKSLETEQVWSPDGQYLIFSSDRQGIDNLYRKRADGSGEIERLTEAEVAAVGVVVVADGRYVVYIAQGAAVRRRRATSISRRARRRYLPSPPLRRDAFPDFSPDGR